jgi:hypothetical protein
MLPKAWKEALWFGRSQHNKENNKLPSLIEKFQSGKKNYNEVSKFFSNFFLVQTSKDLPSKNH